VAGRGSGGNNMDDGMRRHVAKITMAADAITLKENRAMRKALTVVAAIALVASATWFVTPRLVSAQGGGTVEVEVKYNGPAQVEKINVNKDTEQCGKEAKIEKVVVGGNKGLANAVASVAGAKGQPTAKKASIDQKSCSFHPHVVAMTPGEIDIINSDGILHNIHTYSTANPSINKAQPKFKKTMTEKFEKPEFVKVTCDVHSWMLGWIAVMPNPYFGITDNNGTAKIENVPPGKYKVQAWHETLGKQEKEVEVKAGQTAKVAFEMKK
jgi:plastocyanin